MSVSVQAGATMTFEKFWRWLKHHVNCILRAGSSEVWLYDQEACHWHLEEDDERNPTVQLVWGKNVVGEMVLDVREVVFVQAMPDPESDQPSQFLFEVVGGEREEPQPIYHFLVAHGFEDEEGHPGQLKH